MQTGDDQASDRKQAIFDGLSQRMRKYVDRIGYDKWDPFQEPKDPIDIRRDKTNRTTQMLVREFLQSKKDEAYGNAYAQGALEIGLGIINEDEKSKGIFDFCCWYAELLRKEKC